MEVPDEARSAPISETAEGVELPGGPTAPNPFEKPKRKVGKPSTKPATEG